MILILKYNGIFITASRSYFFPLPPLLPLIALSIKLLQSLLSETLPEAFMAQARILGGWKEQRS